MWRLLHRSRDVRIDKEHDLCHSLSRYNLILRAEDPGTSNTYIRVGISKVSNLTSLTLGMAITSFSGS